ncbi:MAG: hypothetical protein ACNI3A_14380 [Desulfovibrio sp.]|uniref:hypothetical protein n=1 Tax=Desulfovibrio sp. 7SRBS1 TaxID=3378064 RepID=UPI003B3D327C
MERVLLKIAKQINALDEASLMALWEKYAAQVARFEPSKRWEEAVLVLSIVQGMHYKNQLFNHHWAQSQKPDGGNDQPETVSGSASSPKPSDSSESVGPSGRDAASKGGKVLKFIRRKDG